MDKRKQENLRVKMNITTALLDLMHQKKLSDISITEIIQNAHVARASFYRNFTSREDVLMVLVEDVLTYYHDTADYEAGEYFSYKNVLRAFQFFYFFRSYVLDLYEFGYGAMILEKLNQFHEEVAGTMPSSTFISEPFTTWRSPGCAAGQERASRISQPHSVGASGSLTYHKLYKINISS